MNRQLVESILQVIESLSEEDRLLLETKLEQKKQNKESYCSSDWETTKKRIIERSKASQEARGGKPLNPSPEEIIRQQREERTQQLMKNCFPNFSSKKNNE